MGFQTQNEDSVMSSFFQAFNRGSMVLFVGKGITETELTPEVCGLPWSCVVTERTEEDFSARFVTEMRKPKEYNSARELPSNLFDRNKLAIIRLNGVDGSLEAEDDEDEDVVRYRREKECRNMLAAVMKRINILGSMTVIGYDPMVPGSLSRTEFTVSWDDCQGSLIFFGLPMVDPQQEKLKNSAQKRGYLWCESPLDKLLDQREQEDSETSVFPGEFRTDTASFYWEEQLVQIPNGIVLRYRNLAELLTEEKLYQIRPFGRIQQSRWFFQFLTRSSVDGPQWYGYLPQSEFYLKRSFENVLVHLVRNILSGKEMADTGYSTPVILEGDPGSSKSIILGALAYRIYTERTYPVIFIRNTELNQQDREELDQMMQDIVPEEKRDTKILLVWDGSAYYNVARTAKEIARYLDNNGRRFVLVCSSYRNTGIAEKKNTDKTWYRLDEEERFAECGEEDAVVTLNRGCYFVEAKRELTSQEFVSLKQKVQEFSGKNNETLRATWKHLEEEEIHTTFECFYELILLLQPNLEQGLSREQRKISKYVEEQLGKIRPQAVSSEVPTDSPMILALREAGVLTEELEQTIEQSEQEEDEQDSFDLARFNLGVAMFSRFKIEAPSSLMFWLLRTGNPEKEQNIYSYENRALFAEITTAIPWILYRENADGSFYFSYRNALEADIFLRKNQVEPEKQVDLVCYMLDYYALDYHQGSGSEDLVMKRQLQNLLRVLGPNSDYGQFRNPDDAEHKSILRSFDRIIAKLKQMRTMEDAIPDVDAGFATMEVTFTREYYSSYWSRLFDGRHTEEGFDVSDLYPGKFTEEAYLERIECLKNAAELAQMSIEKLENQDVDNSEKRQAALQINSLTVELVYCNMKQEELWKEYQALRESKGRNREGAPEGRRFSMSYQTQYRMLVNAINSDPLNGYAYNALFTLFEKEYAKASDDRRLKLLSEIQMLVEDAENMDVYNRGALGRDELSEHILRIAQYRSDTYVTLASIRERTCQPMFIRLFDDMLQENSPAAVMFVCQQELDHAGLGRNMKVSQSEGAEDIALNNRQLQTCEEIRAFMRQREYMPSIERNPHALYLLLRVSWMCYNRRPLADRGECRLTYIREEEWKDILWICRAYEDCAGNNRRPLVVLIHALAVVQVQNDYVEANALLESLSKTAFYASPRLRVPYMICEPSGEPREYSGTVLSVKDHRGFIKVENVPKNLGSKTGVRFYSRNLRGSGKLEEHRVIKPLEMGIGYTGFSLYTEEGRKKRMEEMR